MAAFNNISSNRLKPLMTIFIICNHNLCATFSWERINFKLVYFWETTSSWI